MHTRCSTTVRSATAASGSDASNMGNAKNIAGTNYLQLCAVLLCISSVVDVQRHVLDRAVIMPLSLSLSLPPPLSLALSL